MDFRRMADRFSPALVPALARFPLAIFFSAATTLVVILNANSFLFSEEDRMRLAAGLATGFVLALAGRLFAESRPEARRTGFALSYVLPFVAPILFEIRGTDWVVPPMLAVAAVMWLSVSAFTRPGAAAQRGEIEDRFWWLNQRAVVSGFIAAAATIIFVIGLFALDRSLDLLFGFSLAELMTRWILPIVCCLLAPVYWLAVLPRLSDYEPAALEKPDFLVRAIGFIGVFVLSPLLIAYALILVAYAIQIGVTRTLPVGVLGWLVTTFVVTGAANWLVLHPKFLRLWRLARFYRRVWFWATLLPLALLALGLVVRIGAYGLTPERLLLIAGFFWALLLALAYCLPGRLGDIRLIPALAGLAFLVLGIGPQNLLAISNTDQATRFEAVLAATGTDGTPDWTPERAAIAGSALRYLMSEETGMARVNDILARRGIAAGSAETVVGVAALIGLPAETTQNLLSENWSRPPFAADPVASTPYLIGEVTANSGTNGNQAGLLFSLVGDTLIATETRPGGARTETDLGEWLGRQEAVETLTDPALDFRLGERRYRLIARNLQVERDTPDAPPRVTLMSGLLFSDQP